MVLTESQLKAVNANKNVIVSAGAGSGKTTVLAGHFVMLVEKHLAHSDEILTITFTRKATAEMKSRIRKLIENEVHAGNCPAEELENFINASVLTSDSFCGSIVKIKCRDYGFTPSFTMADADDFRDELKLITETFLTEVVSDQRYAEFFSSVFSIVKAEDVISFFVQLADPENSCFNPVCQIEPVSSAEKYISSVGKTAEKNRRSAIDKMKQYLDSGIEKGDNGKIYRTVMSIADSDTPDISAIDNLLSSVKRRTAISSKNENAAELKKLRDEFEEEFNYYISFAECLRNEKFVHEFYSLVSDFEKKVLTYKRVHNVLCFSDVKKMAIDILLHEPDVRSYYKKKFKYVLTDEFQDNNGDDKKLLYLLCEKKSLLLNRVPEFGELEEGKLFMVGDEKQSIYRFRGADVSVIKDVRKNFTESDVSIMLNDNFRTEKLLVDQFNRWFALIMGDNNENSYEADFSSLQPKPETSVKPKIVYNTLAHAADESDNKDESEEMADNYESEAFSIAKMIKERIVGTDDFLIPDASGSLRRPYYSDVCILLSKSTRQDVLEKALKLQGVPYKSDRIKSVSREALLSDFYYILQNSLYPGLDRIAERAILNSPLKSFINSPELSALCKEGSITRVLRYIYYDMCYRNFIISNPDNQVFEEHFLWLFSLGCSYEKKGKTITEFTHTIGLLINSGKQKTDEFKILEPLLDCVSIMSVHRSKGLEFPIVIIAQMQTESKSDDLNFKAYVTDDFLFLPCLRKRQKEGYKFVPPAYAEKDSDRALQDAETKRLFYVAVTRAEYHLVFSDAPCKISPRSLTFRDLFEVCRSSYSKEEKDPVEYVTYNLIKKEKTYSKGRISTPAVQNSMSWYDGCDSFSPIYESNHIPVTTLEDFSESETGEQLAAVSVDDYLKSASLQSEFGTYVHSLISARLNGIEPEKNDLFYPDACFLSDNFLHSSFYEKIKTDYIIKSEVAYTLYDSANNVFKEGIIDFIAENEDECIVVDFKTSTCRTDSAYMPQIEEYISAVSSIRPGKRVTGYLFYLRAPENPVKMT